MQKKPRFPFAKTWNILSDGIPRELRAGLNRGIKHMDLDIEDDQIERIIEQQEIYLTNWLAETFDFGDGNDE